MKYKLLLIIVFIFTFTIKVHAEEPKPGYSEWSPTPSGDANEESDIQYGRQVPIKWSEWSTTASDSPDQRSKEGETRRYVNNSPSEASFYEGVEAKSLYRWNFGEKLKVVYFYADVDTYRKEDYQYYEGPPLELYCDGKKIASTGPHDVLRNWNPNINTYCQRMELKMLSNTGHGRNQTSIVGTWVTTTSTYYSHVIAWNDGQDWRFNEPYTRVYGSNPHKPTSRTVYSYPLTYKITYYLDGGTPTKDLINKYTVLDDVELYPCTKIGYDFLGYYDKDGNLVESFTKGKYGDLVLYAKYKRRLPVLYVGYTYFDTQDENMSSSEVIKQASARAMDELEGDISENIRIKSITYTNKNKTDKYPNYLELDNEDEIYITFVVSNSVGGTAEVTRKFYILGKGKNNEDYSDNLEIYSRYINEEYLYTLSDNSVWKTREYQEKLYEAFSFMEE